MTFIDTNQLPVVERKPGWRGRYFDSPSMTFAHYEFDAGSSIHEHSHPQEEVWQIVEGELEIAIDGVAKRVGPGFVGIVPSNTRHAVKAISSGKAIIVDYPLRDHHPDRLPPLQSFGLAGERVSSH
jgi:quercetin dioxygenase-like cupin family protein